MLDLKVIRSMAICTKSQQIYSVIWHTLSFCAKSMVVMDEWMDGWMDGWVDGKAGLRITYSNQLLTFSICLIKVVVINCMTLMLPPSENLNVPDATIRADQCSVVEQRIFSLTVAGGKSNRIL